MLVIISFLIISICTYIFIYFKDNKDLKINKTDYLNSLNCLNLKLFDSEVQIL